MNILRIDTRWVERLGEKHKGFYTLEAFFAGEWHNARITSRQIRRLNGTEIIGVEAAIQIILRQDVNVAQPVTLADLKLMGLGE